jgi:hypothetical protein
MRHPNLFSISENVLDSATNGKFTLGSLFFDSKAGRRENKTETDKAGYQLAKTGEIPDSYRQKLEAKKNAQSENGEEESIKEEKTMPFFHIQEGCNCGKCPSCKSKKAKKGLVKESNGYKSWLRLDEAEGLGVSSADGNVYKIPVNQYQGSDSNFVGDGDSAETSKQNIPSLLAAKTAGGNPDMKTYNNGINKKDSYSDVFKVKPVADNGN